jgi:hypothetical protein
MGIGRMFFIIRTAYLQANYRKQAGYEQKNKIGEGLLNCSAHSLSG